MRSGLHRDTIVLLAVAALACGIGVMTQLQLQGAYFYQTWAPETVMFACGHGFVWPLTPPASLLDFLTLKTPAFDCRALEGVATDPPHPFFWSSPWLYWAAGASWWLFGVTQTALAPMLGLFHAAYAAGVFVLLRLCAPLWAAALVGTLIALSPIAISMLELFRDYSKAPFVVWAIVAMVWMLRRRGTRTAPLAAGLLGLLLSIGAGFRPDIWVLAPVIGLALLGAVLAPQTHVLRLATMLAFSLAVAAGLLPQWLNPGPVTLSSPALQGATLPFDRSLKLQDGGYDLGHRYSDELTMSAMVADIGRSVPPDTLQGAALVRAASSAAMQRYLLNFPADIATRALKASVLVLGFYPQLTPEALARDPGRPPYPVGTRLPALGAEAVARLAFPAMPLLVLCGLAIGLGSLALRRPLEAAVLAAAVLTLSAGQSLQFSIRHFFHLEWVFWFGLAGFLAVPALWRALRTPELRRRIGLGAIGLLSLVIVGAIAWNGLVAYQTHRLTTQLANLIDGPQETLTLSPEPQPDGSVEIPIAVPAAHRAVLAAAPDYLSEIGPIRPPPSDMRIVAAVDRLLLRVGGPACGGRTVQISTRFARTAFAWQTLTQDIAVSVPADGASVTVLVPALYRPTQWLAGLRASKDDAPCILAVARALTDTSLPSLFSAVLEPGWRNRSWHHGFGRL